MRQREYKKDSIYFHLFSLLVFSAFISAVAFFILNYVGDGLVSRYYDDSGYEEKKNQEIVEQMQQYITENGFTSKDVDALAVWIRRQKIISVQIYKDGRKVFDSLYPERELWAEDIVSEGYEWEVYYPIRFADGEAKLRITGMYAYQLYSYAMLGELVLCFGLFLLIVLRGIRNRINYILLLGDEIEILEGGSLDYNITVQGNDELAALAEGLDSMRLSFLELIRQESEITAENQRIITEMSHDIRTPVTSIMLYTEILKKGNYKDGSQFREYVEKIDVKAHRLKQLTDHLFHYTLTTGGREIVLEEPECFKTVFYDLLSETGNYLEQRGCCVIFNVHWMERKVTVLTDYLIRIMDNITSNIIKYADMSEPVTVYSLQEDGRAGFIFDNMIMQSEKTGESNGIGLRSIKSMMMKMGGKCIVEDDSVRFRITLLFACQDV